MSEALLDSFAVSAIQQHARNAVLTQSFSFCPQSPSHQDLRRLAHHGHDAQVIVSCC